MGGEMGFVKEYKLMVISSRDLVYSMVIVEIY